jgi:hypothetical protein
MRNVGAFGRTRVWVGEALGWRNSGEFSYTVVMWVRLRGEGGLLLQLGLLPSFLCVLSASVRELIAAVLFISRRHGEHGGGEWWGSRKDAKKRGYHRGHGEAQRE